FLPYLKPSEIKAYLVVQHAIQKEQKHPGMISVRQVAAVMGTSYQHAHAALKHLREQNLIIARYKTGRITRFANPFAFRGRGECSLAGERLSSRTGEQGRSPRGEQPLDIDRCRVTALESGPADS